MTALYGHALNDSSKAWDVGYALVKTMEAILFQDAELPIAVGIAQLGKGIFSPLHPS